MCKLSVKTNIGILLYNGDQSEFVRLIKSIITCQRRCADSDIELHLMITLKWNSEPTFSVEAIMRQHKCEFTILSGTSNDGFGAAHNKMMKLGFDNGADCYLCLNPDGFLEPEALVSLTRFYQNLGKPALIEALQFPREHPKPYNPFTGETHWCSGACLYISKDIFDKIGGFDENIFMYFEDIDLSWRVRDCGLQCYVCSAALFYHNVRENKSALISQMMLESGRYLAYKWCAKGFQDEMERLLVERNYYPAIEYIPPVQETKRIESKTGLQEWRQLLSFSLPRW